MNSKILYMQDPIISASTSYGSLFSIIDDKVWPWIFSNFIQIRYAHWWHMYAFDNHHLFLSNCPAIEYYIIPQSIIISKWNKSLKELIIDVVNSDFYLFLYTDYYYIPASESFLKIHGEHEIFIFGYDLERDLVFVADNLQNGKFIKTQCTFDELEKGYWAVKGNYSFQTDVRFLKTKKNVICNFDLEQVIIELDNYLQSKRTIDLLDEQKCDFGFDAVERILETLNNTSGVENYIDIRPFHLLYEHKLLMDMRIKYMVGNGYLLNNNELVMDFTLLKKKYLIIRNNVLKYNVRHDPKILSYIVNNLHENIKIEKNLITNLIISLTQ